MIEWRCRRYWFDFWIKSIWQSDWQTYLELGLRRERRAKIYWLKLRTPWQNKKRVFLVGNLDLVAVVFDLSQNYPSLEYALKFSIQNWQLPVGAETTISKFLLEEGFVLNKWGIFFGSFKWASVVFKTLYFNLQHFFKIRKSKGLIN